MAPLVALALGALASVVVAHGLSSCGTQALECRHQYLWPTGLDALWHVRSSWTRDWTHVSCIGRRILNHWTTREVQAYFLMGETDTEEIHNYIN